jgi:hypothetical protein
VDVDACLAELRALVRRSYDEHLDEADRDRVLELVDALDGWMSGGGFLPGDWRRLRVDEPLEASP